MTAASDALPDSLNGPRGAIAMERAIGELRRGRAIFCHDAETPSECGVIAVAVETVRPDVYARLTGMAQAVGRELSLVITPQRAATLGILTFAEGASEEPVCLRLHGLGWRGISALAASSASDPVADVLQHARLHSELESCDTATVATLELARQARLLPAIIVLRAAPPLDSQLLQIEARQLQGLAQQDAAAVVGLPLERVSEARVPLAGHENCRLVLFRDPRDASEHVAILIGDALERQEPDAAVPLRMHSACLTGDLLGSLRCDCGDQLRGAVEQLAAAGGGVLLYLAQEGRGIGLANKLRAYTLQDAGLDTIEADRHLGFRDDERNYGVAAAMLCRLGLTRVRLLTNNPAKLQALEQAGIEVVSDERLLGTVNPHNLRYLRAKRERAGHLVPEITL
ncbi:MAG: GTP cyclohydrolase II RibA [Steroidobacteraceae bacterium]